MIEASLCPRCQKPSTICVCERIVALANKTPVLILQHPQEQDVILGTARLLSLSLEKCTLQIGLSWPSLAVAVEAPVDAKRWAVLYPSSLKKALPPAAEKQNVVLLDRAHDPVPLAGNIDGIVVLDGSWSQAKALWWRNPWLLKLQRIIVHPQEPSLYGKMRAEPRRSYVSTLESVADTLAAVDENTTVRDQLRRLFRTMLQRVRDTSKK